eukprot:scaffold181333_cov19-Tisochrysis_lutea.AAC.3
MSLNFLCTTVNQRYERYQAARHLDSMHFDRQHDNKLVGVHSPCAHLELDRATDRASKFVKYELIHDHLVGHHTLM